jgi:hypothetical protein
MAVGGIDWRAGELPREAWEVKVAMGLDDKVLALGYVHVPGRVAGYEVGAVWSSTDGLTWNLVSGPNTFSKIGSAILDASPDGHGGIFAAGFVSSNSENYSYAALWHSRDGLTWTQVDLGSPEHPWALVVAANEHMAVAEETSMRTDRWARYVWWSADGVNWSSAELPSDGSQPRRPPLLAGGAGGFEILETSAGDQPGHAWHSDDGRTWVQTQAPPGLTGADVAIDDPTSLLAVGGGFVAVGRVGSLDAGKPAAWTTADGKTWTQSVMEDPGDRFGCKSMCQPTVVTQVGKSLVAVGYPKKYTSDDLSPAAAAVVWTSEDAGRTWKLLGSGPAGMVPAVAATFHYQPIVLDTTECTCSFRGSIAWKPGESPRLP